MDCLFSYDDSLPHFLSDSLGELADAACAADDAHAHKRVRFETRCELLDDTSALHEWPVPAKRARRCGRRKDAWELGGSLDSHAFLQKNATPSTPATPPFGPARPRANAMHVHDEDGVAANDVVPPSLSRSQLENTSLFVRFAQLASCNGITALHLPSPDKFPTAVQMEAIARAITAA